MLTAITVTISHHRFAQGDYCAFHVLMQPNFRRLLLFARSSSNSPRSLEGFRRTLVQKFIQIRQRVKNFPIDPHCKNCPLSECYNVAESGQFLQWGSMGKFFICCRITLKFRPSVRLKR